VRQFRANLCFDSLNWGAVGDGLRPRLCSEMMGQATFVEAKLHDESTMIQRCFDDNIDDNKR